VSVAASALRGLVRAYQLTVSPLLPAACRFEPSCSRYAMEALTRHGALRGSLLTLKRLGRCHPWGGMGYDPVPPAINRGGHRDRSRESCCPTHH
jgi:putative membrane protein insertion efficiency factor